MSLRSQAAAIADKYIERGGGKPNPTANDFAVDLMKLANFILWHNKRDMHGCVYPDEAFEVMCRLLSLEQHRIREIVRPEDRKE
jgi:hypothetical protein